MRHLSSVKDFSCSSDAYLKWGGGEDPSYGAMSDESFSWVRWFHRQEIGSIDTYNKCYKDLI